MKKVIDPLWIVGSNNECGKCTDNPDLQCDVCNGTGYIPVNLNNIWYPSAGFLVCGGPSINSLPYEKLSERGIVSLGINNIATKVPVTAWCHTDSERKFHHGLYLDPKCMTFTPAAKFSKKVVARLPDGSFAKTNRSLRECPNTFGFKKKMEFNPETFFSTEYAQWGTKSPKMLSTMFVGLRLMHYLGCYTVFLIGADFTAQEGSQQYAFKQDKKGRQGVYNRYDEYLNKLKPIFDANKFKVYNCNPDSKCTAFDYMPFEEAFKICKGAVPNELNPDGYYTKSIVNVQIDDENRRIKIKDLIEIQNKQD